MGQAAWGRPEMASSALVPSPPPSPTYRVVKWAFVTPIFRLFLRGRCRGMELCPSTDLWWWWPTTARIWIHRCWAMPCRGR